MPYEIRAVEGPDDVGRLGHVLDQIWGSHTPIVGAELLRALTHAGGYVVGVYDEDDGQIVGGSVGFIGRHRERPSLHSHVTGVLPGVRGTGLGRTLKLHQKAWAAERGLEWVTWTFDPLVRRNAHFNLAVLGAVVAAYLVDFYGPIEDAINAGDETDRLLVAWAVGDGQPTVPTSAERAGATAVPTPEDIVVLRRRDPAAATAWRRRLRRELGDAIAAGATVQGFTPQGEYLVGRGP